MKPVLHLFKEDLTKQLLPGSKDPPRTIRAKDLDGNNAKLTLLQGEGDPPLYEVKYTKSGTIITRLLPDGENIGDIFYWDGAAWDVLAAPQDSTLRALTIVSGVLAWTATEDCDD